MSRSSVGAIAPKVTEVGPLILVHLLPFQRSTSVCVDAPFDWLPTARQNALVREIPPRFPELDRSMNTSPEHLRTLLPTDVRFYAFGYNVPAGRCTTGRL
jgi:hypothetical protein